MSDQNKRPPRPPLPTPNPSQQASTSADTTTTTTTSTHPLSRRIAEVGIRNPTWSVTRRHRTETSPSPVASRGGSSSRDSSGDKHGDPTSSRAASGEPYYRSKTITSTERVQILQMPLELTDENAERLRYLTMSPTSEASRQVSSTTTTFEAGGTPVIGAVGANGVPLISGVYFNRDCRQTTTIITTTTTTYKIIEDDPQDTDDFELVNIDDSKEVDTGLTVDLPLGVSRKKQKSKLHSSFVLVGSSTESSPIASTSEEDSDSDASIISAKKHQEKSDTLQTEVKDDNNISETPQDDYTQTSPFQGSNANTSTFSSISPSSEEEADYVDIRNTKRNYQISEDNLHKNSLYTTIPSTELNEEPITEYIQLYEPTPYKDNYNKDTEEVSNRPDEAVPTAAHVVEPKPAETPRTTKVDPFSKLTGLFKRTSAHEDYPTSQPFEGHLSQTSKAFEVATSPLDSQVSVYHSGRSDQGVPAHVVAEPTETSTSTTTKVDPFHKLTGLFKRSSAHEDYPSSHPFEGPLTHTSRAYEVEGTPLDTHVSVYHTGRSDEVPVRQAEPTPSEPKTDTLGRITNLFRRSAAHDDYPLAVHYDGPTTSTHFASQVESHPIDHHVSVYHTGRSDEVGPASQVVEQKPAETSKVVDPFHKLTGLFKRTSAHEDYPISQPFDGHVTDTTRAYEVDRTPLDTHVSVYHSGRSDEAVPTAAAAHVVAEPTKPAETTTTIITTSTTTTKVDPFSKLTGLFKRSSAHEDYPHSQPFDGHVTHTARASEVEGTPLDTHVSVYHPGRSDEAAPVQTEPLEQKTDTLGRISSLFRKSVAHDDYPLAVHYDGPTTSTQIADEIGTHPLDHHVSVYHTGRSDEAVPTAAHVVEPKPAETPRTTKVDPFSKLTGLFKRTSAHEDYPTSQPFEGHLSQTSKAFEVATSPLDSQVSVYHSGRSDQGVPAHVVAEPTETSTSTTTKVDPFHKLTGLFKRSSAHEDYPSSHPFEGPLTHTSRAYEVEGTPLDTHVSVYHTGRSDEVPVRQAEPTPSEPKTDTLGRITNLFRRSAAHDDYPLAVHYDGPTTSTHFASQVESHPIDHHVSVYHTGRSDEVGPASQVVEQKPAETSKVVDPFHKLTGLFKRTSAHEDYPISQPFDGHVTDTTRAYEVDRTPLDTHVSVYHSGRSDEAVPTAAAAHVVAEPTKPAETTTTIITTSTTTTKVDPFSKLTGLFKRSSAHEDYPHSQPFDGHVTHTARASEVEGTPLDTHVSVYHPGRSDEAAPVQTEPLEQKTDTLGRISSLFRKSVAHDDYPLAVHYDGPTTSTQIADEIGTHPLDHHVSVYHTGRSDEAVPTAAHVVEPKPAETPRTTKVDPFSKLTGLFKRTSAHEDYPTSQPFEGHLSQTSKAFEVATSPLDSQVSVYHSGRSDQGVPAHVVAEPTETSTSTTTKVDPFHKLTGLFKRSSAHEDYPSSHPFEGPLTHTSRAYEVEGTPLDTHVSVYHTGRSDEVPVRQAEPTPSEPKTDTLGRITNLFRRSAAHDDYPLAVHYDGPTTSTHFASQVESHPIDHHVSVYHTGRSDEVGPASQVVEQKPAETSKVVDPFHKLTGLFKRTSAHEDYPISQPFDGHVTDTTRAYEVDRTPLDTHVSVYHSGRSDEAVPTAAAAHVVAEPTKPAETTTTIITTSTTTTKVDPFSKLTGLFKRSSAHEDYPHSQPFDGHVTHTARASEVEGTPLDTHVSVYHPGRSDEAAPVQTEPLEQKTDTLGRISSLFRKSVAHDDYPLAVHYDGPTTSTQIADEIGTHPLDHHVSVYHTGRSDEAVPTAAHVVEPKPAETPRTTKVDPFSKLTGLFKRTSAHEDYPTSQPFEGHLSQTSKAFEVATSPLDSQVSVYHSGRSDQGVPAHVVAEPTETSTSTTTKVDPFHKLTGLFKRSSAHEDYPSSHPFEGPLTHTSRAYEVEGTPLDTHVSVYHTGRSDEVPVRQAEPTPSEPKTDTLGRITNLFRRSAAHDDYPLAVHYDGPTTSTHFASQVESHPIDHHVSVYHTGRSDEVGPASQVVEQKPAETSKVVDPFHKLTGLFKRTSAHEDYPISQPFDGHVTDTTRAYEVDRTPLDTHVSVYHSGRSDEAVPTAAAAHVVAEPTKPAETTTTIITTSTTTTKVDPFSKLTGLFKRSSAHEDYPHSQPFDGHVTHTARASEVEGTPLDTHVSVYHPGRSDEAAPVQTEPLEQKTDTLGRISSLFRKSVAHDDYPLAVHYDGPTTSTQIADEIGTHPLDHHVSVYHTGRSDEAVPTAAHVVEPKPAETPRTTKVDPFSKLTGLFKRTSAHEDYPTSQPFEGHLSQTSKAFEVATSPLDSQVSVYHSGRSDQGVPAHVVAEPTETSTSTTTKVDPFHKLTGLFKRSSAHEDYPSSHPFEGPLTHTSRAYEVEGTPLDTHVSVYHTGRSDEVPVRQAEPTPSEPKTDTLGRITNLFRRSAAHDDYPLAVHYDGPTTSTHFASQVESHPIDHHVSVYHTGRSDEVGPASQVVEQKPAETSKVVDPFHKLTGLFKRTSAHEDYPISQPFDGHVTDTTRAYEVDRTPLDTHVSVYHSGRSDEAVPTAAAAHVVAEPTKPAETTTTIITTSTTTTKVDPFSKLTGLFKRSSAHEDYPHSQPFDGHVTHTARASEVEGTPLDTHVSVYHPGRSDEAAPVQTEPLEQKTDTLGRISSLFRKSVAHDDYPLAVHYDGPTTSTQIADEIGTHPLDHHVSVYHTGRSDEAVPTAAHVVEPKPAETPRTTKVDPFSKLTGLFKRTSAHEDYPTSQPFEGHLSQTSKAFEVATSPLDSQVSVYHSGRSDQGVPAHVVAEPTETSTSTTTKVDPFHKLTGLFKRSSAHEDYPSSHPFEGPLTHTSRAYEVEGTPLDTHVSVYHTGRSDEVPVRQAEPTPSEPKTDTLGRITNLFRRSAAHDDYPLAVHYDGPTTSTQIADEIGTHPLDHHVSVYHTGRSDEAVPTAAHVVEPKPAETPRTTKVDPFSKLTGLFKRTSAHEDYPTSQPFEGHLSQTSKAFEVATSPLDSQVSVYHSGRSDQGVPAHVVAEPTETSTSTTTKVDPFHKLTGLFKRSSAHEDYPSSHPFEGPLTHTSRAYEVEGTPLDTHVSVYHTGRSDEVPVRQAEPTPSEPKTDTLGRITNLFRRSAAHDDYPLAVHYDGPTTSTHFASQVESHPIDHHVSVYHTGRSDEVGPASQVVEQKPAETSKVVDPFHKLTGLFKRTSAHEDYPISQPFDGHVTDTTRAYEVDRTPLDTHVSVYHSGSSDEAVPTAAAAHVVAEPTKPAETTTTIITTSTTTTKVDPFSKLTGLFKRSSAHEDYPHSQPFDGHVTHTARASEVEGTPLDTHVSVYHPGRSDGGSLRESELTQSDQLTKKIYSDKVKAAYDNNREETLLSSKSTSFPTYLVLTDKSNLLNHSTEKVSYSNEINLEDTYFQHNFASPFRAIVDQKAVVSFESDGASSIDYHPPRRRISKDYVRPESRAMATSTYHDHDYQTTLGLRTSKSYTDNILSSSVPKSRTTGGWTSVTETTTITYAKRTSTERMVGGRKQHVTENIVVHNYNGTLPPLSPTSTARKALVSPSATKPPLPRRYYNVDQRYNYYRSRSQDPMAVRTDDKWLQTDLDNNYEDTWRSATHNRGTSPDTENRRNSRSMNRSSTADVISTYRSYSSHLYNRHAYVEESYRSPTRHHQHDWRGQSTSPPLSRAFVYNDQYINGQVSGQRYENGGAHRLNGHNKSFASAPPMGVHERTDVKLQTRHKNSMTTPTRKLMYQKSNLDELPIDQLFSRFDDDEGTLRNGRSHASPTVLPLETRLMEPGEYTRSGERVRSVPIRRARQRVRNYCAML